MALENVSINTYHGGITLNVNEVTIVRINPANQQFQMSETDEMSFNLSQMSHVSSVECQNPISIPMIIKSIKKDLEKMEEKEKKLQ